MSTTDAARARWRADLHEYGSAALRVGGLEAMAVDSDTEAARLRDYANLLDALAAAKAGGDPEVLRTVKQQILAHRQAARSSNAVRPGVMDNFTEPSDDELIALGY